MAEVSYFVVPYLAITALDRNRRSQNLHATVLNLHSIFIAMAVNFWEYWKTVISCSFLPHDRLPGLFILFWWGSRKYHRGGFVRNRTFARKINKLHGWFRVTSQPNEAWGRERYIESLMFPIAVLLCLICVGEGKCLLEGWQILRGTPRF